ncbi:MAG: hypothetical protein NC517_10620 [Firmicutes bacterium]|nr:hypothetical protein [Bacillota bacterium]
MKKAVFITLILAGSIMLAACGLEQETPGGSDSMGADSGSAALAGVETPGKFVDSAAQKEAQDTALGEADPGSEEQRLAFGKVLWDVYQQGILPDGGILDYSSMEDAENNSFAVMDIDNDGQEELLLFWDHACMAGMIECVFGYADGAVYSELTEFPGQIFYDNGVVEAGWSHNQGLAGDFWPYDLYRYDAESDTYQSLGGVDAWDRRMAEENSEGVLFPTDIDADGDGVVYYILPADWNGQYEDIPLVDGAEYESWRSAYIGGAEQIQIPYQSLTEENIAALGYPKPDIVLTEPAG